jgi:hypothetical protein
MATYSINIKMSDETVREMSELGFSLYAFKAVQASGSAGKPLVWFVSDTYSSSTKLEWQVDYQAYSSFSEIVPKGHITAKANYDIDLGQTFIIDNLQGVGNVVAEGSRNAITIYNDVNRRFTCGISQETGGTFSQICAAPIVNGSTNTFIPIEKVLLLFATEQYNTGTVIIQSFGPGVMVDLTGATSRTVEYSIAKRWTWSGTWAQAVNSRTDIVPLLVESGTNVETMNLDARQRLTALRSGAAQG